MKFEASYKKLEEAAAALRDDSVSLEDSIKNFEAAAKYYKECRSVLQDAKQRLTVLDKETGIETEGDLDDGL